MVRRNGLGRKDGTHLLQNGKLTLAGGMLREGEVDFVFLGGLPREADRAVGGVITIVGRPAQVRLIEQRALQLVVIIAHLIAGSVLPPESGEEP